MHSSELTERDINLPSHFSDLLLNFSQGANGYHDANDANNYQCDVGEVLREKQLAEGVFRLLGMVVLLRLGCLLIYYHGLSSRIGRISAFSG
jgi:hypothetical protein